MDREFQGHPYSRRSPGVNWQIDFDYRQQLAADDVKFLNDFTEEFYMSSSSRGVQTQEQLRERWRAYKANQSDAMSYHAVGNSLVAVDGVSTEVEVEAVGKLLRAELSEWLDD